MTSYVIARTLGVVDSTKASTSDLDKHRDASPSTSPLAHPVILPPEHNIPVDASTTTDQVQSTLSLPHEALSINNIIAAGGSTRSNFDKGTLGIPGSGDSTLSWPSATDDSQTQLLLHQHLRQARSPGPTAFFFNPSEEHNLALSGANVLSPAVSRQNSPPLERKQRSVPPADVSDVGTSNHDTESSESVSLAFISQPSHESVSIMRRRGGHNQDQR